jgi:pyruvate dehydrogenase E1 component beta subunit
MGDREIYYWEAIQEALREEMRGDENVFLLGEDIGVYGGAFGVTRGMISEFGWERVRNTPISENSIVGLAVGAALLGCRPVVEIMFMDFITLAIDQIVNHASKLSYIYGGSCKVPLVIRTPCGAGRSYGATHSQNLESLLMSVPGLKLVFPSTPYDAKGLLKTAIRDNNPVIFVEHKLLYGKRGFVPKDEYFLPFGEACIRKEGKDVTVISYSLMVQLSLEVAEELEGQGLSAEVIDLRTLKPLDSKTLIESVKKTGRAVIVEEGCKGGGVGAEIGMQILEGAFGYLDAPILRVAAKDIPIPYSPSLEKVTIPTKEDIKRAIKEVVLQ